MSGYWPQTTKQRQEMLTNLREALGDKLFADFVSEKLVNHSLPLMMDEWPTQAAAWLHWRLLNMPLQPPVPPKPITNCLNCGNAFPPRSPWNRQYCCAKCQREAYERRQRSAAEPKDAPESQPVAKCVAEPKTLSGGLAGPLASM